MSRGSKNSRRHRTTSISRKSRKLRPLTMRLRIERFRRQFREFDWILPLSPLHACRWACAWMREQIAQAKPSRTRSSVGRNSLAMTSSFQPYQALEDRRLLATSVWDGGGANANWTTPENWAGDVAPMANDELVFPVGAAQTTNVNNFAAGTNFGSMLIVGSNYNLSGNQVVLNGSVTNNGSSNTFGIPVQLGSTGGFSSSSSTFTISGAIDTNANGLSLEGSGSTLIVSSQISGSGSVSTSGTGIVALSGNNTYTGVTTVGGNTLALRHDNALGAADNTEATGTRITDSNGEVQLENGVTVTDELLTSSPSVNLNLYSIGTGVTNTWTGDVDGGGSSAAYQIFLRANDTNNRLVVDGDLIASNYNLYVYGSSTGTTEINGSVTAARLQVQSGTAEVNSTFPNTITTFYGPYVNSSRPTLRNQPNLLDEQFESRNLW